MGLKRKTSATTTAFPKAHSCLLFFPRSSHPRAGCRLSRQLHNPVVLWFFSTHSGQMMRQTLPTENTCWQKLNHSSAQRSLMTCAHAGFRCSRQAPRLLYSLSVQIFFCYIELYLQYRTGRHRVRLSHGSWPAQNLDIKSLGRGVSVSWKYLMM